MFKINAFFVMLDEECPIIILVYTQKVYNKIILRNKRQNK